VCEEGFIQIRIVFFDHAHGEWKESELKQYRVLTGNPEGMRLL
jgi:hypothetical protein